MRNIKLLDCTLRDGGFINDWEFGLGSIRDVIFRLDKAGIEYIEVGFIDDSRAYDVNRTILPHTKYISKIFETININQAKIVGMINYGTCSIDNVEDCSDSILNGMRVIFKKSNADEALNYCKELKDKGYDVFVQPVSITSYTDIELLELLKKINELDPYAVSIVDTYGLMFKNDLIHYFYLMEHNLLSHIALGYHSHNNFQLAYANATELLSLHTERELIIDSSLFGMGKGAGNANTELISMFLNSKYQKDYTIDHILEAIDVNILKLKEKYEWGYSLLYYISASNDCHPSYVKFLLDKKTLSVKSVNEIVSKLPHEDKLLYNESLINRLYFKYQEIAIDDESSLMQLRSALENKRVLILAPGNTLNSESVEIQKYIDEFSPIIISTNFIPQNFKTDFIFVSNSKRYNQLLSSFKKNDKHIQIIATSNIEESLLKIDIYISYLKLLEEIECDNSTIMLLNLLYFLDVRSIGIAGFDGFGESDDYIDDFLDYGVAKNILQDNENRINKALSEINHNDMTLITSSKYQFKGK